MQYGPSLLVTAIRADGSQSTRVLSLGLLVNKQLGARTGYVGRMLDCSTLWALGEDVEGLVADERPRVVFGE